MGNRLEVSGVAKSFTMHLRDGIRLPVVVDVHFAVADGECVVLTGPSGAGKSSILRMIFGNYGVDDGRILVADGDDRIDMAAAAPRTVIDLRRRVVAYVSQFLRVVPRVPTRDVVAEPLVAIGMPAEAARARAEALLARLNLPQRLWDLPPGTFSGGEQQRVNVARGFVTNHKLLLLDEPTASLDAENRDVVTALIREKAEAGVAVLGIFHDAATRDAVANRQVDVTAFRPLQEVA